MRIKKGLFGFFVFQICYIAIHAIYFPWRNATAAMWIMGFILWFFNSIAVYLIWVWKRKTHEKILSPSMKITAYDSYQGGWEYALYIKKETRFLFFRLYEWVESGTAVRTIEEYEDIETLLIETHHRRESENLRNNSKKEDNPFE